jgi:soluble lytic murein transglycosylase-like protein
VRASNRPALIAATICSIALAAPAAAGAAVPHAVQPGETLWSIAAANNLTTRTVAVFNGLPENAQIVAGTTIQVPSTMEGFTALQRAGLVPGSSAQPTPVGSTASTTSASSGAPAVQGAYTVRPGDTLSGLASQTGVSAAYIAAMNGLELHGLLIAGTVIKLPGGAPAPANASAPAPTATVVPKAAPDPTATRLSADEVRQVAIENGVPASLAAAIAWQESGFNNSMVSSANARGVMQVTPGTWDWVQDNLASRSLNPDSAVDNVHAGVLYLKQLLAETGGNEDEAIAAYYQGLSSVRSIGLYDDTKQYVANVQALRPRFGGPAPTA